MKQKILNAIISSVIGFLGCLVLTKQGCVYLPEKYVFKDNVWVEHRTDTLVSVVTKKVPVPITVEKIVEIEKIPDWVKNIKYSVDSSGDSSFVIPYNIYIDTTKTPDYEFAYKAEVMGEMLSFDSKINIFRKDSSLNKETTNFVPKKPVWTSVVGLSNQLSFQAGLGYKGFSLVADFDRVGFKQVYLTKTFILK